MNGMSPVTDAFSSSSRRNRAIKDASNDDGWLAAEQTRWAESLHHGCAQSNYVVGGDVYFILLVPREYVWRHEKMEL